VASFKQVLAAALPGIVSNVGSAIAKFLGGGTGGAGGNPIGSLSSAEDAGDGVRDEIDLLQDQAPEDESPDGLMPKSKLFGGGFNLTGQQKNRIQK